MVRTRTILSNIIVLVLLLIVSGCASSALVEIWSDPLFRQKPLSSILVIAAEKDPVQRRIWEDVYTAELKKHSLSVTPSYRMFPSAVPDTDQVQYAVGKNGFDGVLITRRMPAESHPQYGQTTIIVQQNMRYDRRRSRFITYYRTMDRYGYVDSLKVYINDIDVWSVQNDGQLIWSATSRSNEPMTEGVSRSNIARQVTEELTDCGFIGPLR